MIVPDWDARGADYGRGQLVSSLLFAVELAENTGAPLTIGGWSQGATAAAALAYQCPRQLAGGIQAVVGLAGRYRHRRPFQDEPAVPLAQRPMIQLVQAARAAISPVALSHIEAGMSVPGERTVVLLAGLLHVEPHELVEGTAYPVAKSERLPSTAPRYTELEHQLALLDLALTGCPNPVERWLPVLEELETSTFDRTERSTIAQARQRLKHSVTSALNSDAPAP